MLPYKKIHKERKKLPVSVQALAWISLNPFIESQWSMLFRALGLKKLNLGSSAHVSLVNESLPFPAVPSVFSVSGPLLPPPHPPTQDFYWPAATLNYHGWKEKQIRRAWNSETDSPSLIVQRENNSNEDSILPSVGGLDRIWLLRTQPENMEPSGFMTNTGLGYMLYYI